MFKSESERKNVEADGTGVGTTIYAQKDESRKLFFPYIQFPSYFLLFQIFFRRRGIKVKKRETREGVNVAEKAHRQLGALETIFPIIRSIYCAARAINRISILGNWLVLTIDLFTTV